MNKSVLVFREFEKITILSIFETIKNRSLLEKIYKEIEEFAKESRIFLIRKGYIQPTSYVGLIETKNAIVEVLPKIYDEVSLKESKTIFLNLLKILYNLPNYKFFENGKFDIEKIPLLEIFIRMFLDEVEVIIKKGLKSDYILKEDNLNFLKGKLIINKEISKNFIHKNKFFCEFDEYHLNRSENKIIKITLKFLLNKSSNFENKRRIRNYLEHLYQVKLPKNIEFDFKNSKINRHIKHYKNALIWARIFLKNKTFSPFSGNKEAFSILYSMEKLFENYVEFKLKKQYKNVKFQKSKLFIKDEEEKPVLYPRPNFIIDDIVADAKWKTINCDNDFSEKDFYQTFVYYHLFNAKELRLYYLKTKFLNSKRSFFYLEKIKLDISPIDLSVLK